MQFSQQEVEFLSDGFSKFEVRSKGEGWAPLPDGMPERMRQRALETRASRLGKRFTEFRSRCRNLRSEIIDGLRQQVEASKLW